MSAPSQAELIRVFGRIGLLSFGGPAAQIALMHRELVEERPWLTEDGFLRALSLCMLLPGPEAMQLATYAGWRLRGTLGGLIAGLLFVLPGAAVILCLALGYALYGQVPLVQAAFSGIKAAVIIIVLQALLKVAQKALTTRSAYVLAGCAFLALFVLGLPFPLIIAAAALYGAGAAGAVPGEARAAPGAAPHTVRTLGLWGSLWALPVVAVWLADHSFLTQIALFFSKLAVVTFGGAYAVLAYMTQTVVQDYGWISTAQMIDALGLAETTPGPLILVTEFVALLAGFAQGGILLALAAGALALWVTFTPCFLWIFLAGPYLDLISTKPRVAAALRAITAAVVGVILNLAIWFGIHVLFRDIGSAEWHAIPVPQPASLDPGALGLTLLAAVLLLGLKRGLVETLATMAAAGLVLSAIWG
ncbi:chromate efflux transporter [Roseobacter sinensis]|uniref:Chromate efflux transporter n=1 Tax=Roseobacter sinensis TaxID=2931391 RepID=A0ABT3BEL6_9RHOB|nr:chromate efflux transporter [Roseobacter sp. WL0113]MCV3271992.1 chromate efflux transporter [Roseobacter sp. WL0113]